MSFSNHTAIYPHRTSFNEETPPPRILVTFALKKTYIIEFSNILDFLEFFRILLQIFRITLLPLRITHYIVFQWSPTKPTTSAILIIKQKTRIYMVYKPNPNQHWMHPKNPKQSHRQQCLLRHRSNHHQPIISSRRRATT